jgi:hypothetical protein
MSSRNPTEETAIMDDDGKEMEEAPDALDDLLATHHGAILGILNILSTLDGVPKEKVDELRNELLALSNLFEEDEDRD